MATRRGAGRVEGPLSNGSFEPQTHAVKVDSEPAKGSPLLPTLLEAALLAVYPTTLILGSIFSSIHPSTRDAVYSATLQSYLPEDAPSYFARKSNVFNVYFVKIGWFWVTLAFSLLVITHPSHGPIALTQRRLYALTRYLCITAAWMFVTQWFFGPAIIDRSFRWTGGQCAVLLSDSPASRIEKEDMSDMREILTHAACKAIGGQWKGGHDISGHVFILVLGSAMLWLEALPAILRKNGVREARLVLTESGSTRNASVSETDGNTTAGARPSSLGIGIKMALAVAGVSWWMLLMTAVYFHTWFEKFTGLSVAFVAIYVVYILPRAIPGWRAVIGMPSS